MAQAEVDEFLEHFGVRGMKWGVRNKTTKKTSTKRVKLNPEDKVVARQKMSDGKRMARAIIGGAIGMIVANAIVEEAGKRYHRRPPNNNNDLNLKKQELITDMMKDFKYTRPPGPRLPPAWPMPPVPGRR